MPNLISNTARILLRCFSKLWKFIRDLGSVLKYCRFSVFMLVVGFLVLVIAPQGQDVLRVMVEVRGPMGGESFWQWISFLLAMTFWGVNAWYWARVMLRIKYSDDTRLTSSNPDRIRWLNRHTPRILGTLAFFILAIGFARAAIEIRGLDIGAEFNTYRNLILFSILSGLMGMVFLVLVVVRQDAIKATKKWMIEKSPSGALGKRLASAGADPYEVKATRLIDLGKSTVIALWVSVAIAFGFFLLFVFNAQSAIVFGTGAILLIAAGSWISVGSILVWWGSEHRIPVLTLLLVYVFVCSFFNDNHVLRSLPAQGLSETAVVTTSFNDWLADHRAADQAADALPVYLVAAEGGGIRAAYWSAIVLSALQDLNPDFGQNMFAISGVSGGSLGGAVFTALLKEQNSSSGLNCTDMQKEQEAVFNGPMQTCAEAVLGHDFLSPTVAAMLYPDLTQRFLPFPIDPFDRARALEGAWEAGWAAQFQSRPFADSFHHLWVNTSGNLPALFLNGTSVETGKRIITSNIAIDDNFTDAFDFFAINQAAIPLSTAVHNSARFTYVSPAGLIEKDSTRWGRIVDGGYFENSGATTASEILRSMMKVVNNSEQRQITPVVIMITNDPKQCKQGEQCADSAPSRMLSEILSPLLSILKTRNSRGSYARDNIKYQVEANAGEFIEFGLQDAAKKGPLPLGWVMSEAAQDVMKVELKKQLQHLAGNQRRLLGLPPD